MESFKIEDNDGGYICVSPSGEIIMEIEERCPDGRRVAYACKTLTCKEARELGERLIKLSEQC